MSTIETTSTSFLKRFFNDSLYRNSLFLVANRGLVVLTGFVFWMVATRLYPVDDVGLAVAFVSSSQLIGSFALFGFDSSIIRFFNSYDRSRSSTRPSSWSSSCRRWVAWPISPESSTFRPTSQ